MPQLGEIRTNAKYQKFLRASCKDCGKERWVLIIRQSPRSQRCRQCSIKHIPQADPSKVGRPRVVYPATDDPRENKRQYMRVYSRTPRGRYHRLKTGAKARGIAFQITIQEFVTWFNEQGWECHYCNQVLNGYNAGHTENALTIERKDNSLPYRLDNMVLSCLKCNVIKSKWFTYNQMLEIGQKYLRK